MIDSILIYMITCIGMKSFMPCINNLVLSCLISMLLVRQVAFAKDCLTIPPIIQIMIKIKNHQLKLLKQ